ncbi:hypothetical protein FA13DRAFT_1325427 [Coprinellus micaceus]|uniref:Uncharacterized protein n=1 Tax=Coprinellus micaceus TaxID=71717 RepID=A0A4Y7SRA5_COPMI|nr:hypothetical protein FA13DRAFT_1325427 [Coprinellus micaceus]
MPSPSDPSDSRGSAHSRPAPIHEVLVRAKEGSLDDIRDLIGRVKTDYLMASEEFQETVSTILDIPKDVERFNPTLQDLAAVVVGLALLTEVAAWYGEGNTSSNHPKVLIAEDFAKKYLFWSLILLRIPATPTSSTSPLEVLPSARQLDNYYHVPALYDRLFTIPGILYQRFPQSLRSTLINIALVWWTALFEVCCARTPKA